MPSLLTVVNNVKILRSSARLRHIFLLVLGAALVPSGLAQQGGRIRIIEGVNSTSDPFGVRPTARPLTPLQRKIGGSIRRKIKELADAGIVSSSAKGVTGAEAFSTRLLQVDSEARIHAYVELGSVEPEKLTVLGAIPGIRVESSNAELSIVQAWIPVDQVESVAELSFVKQVT